MKKFVTFLAGLALVVSFVTMTKNEKLQAAIDWKDPYLAEGDKPVYTMGSAVTSFPNDLKNYTEAEIKEFDPNHQYGKGRFYDWDGYKFRAPKLKEDGTKEFYYDFYQSQAVGKITEDSKKPGYVANFEFGSPSLSSFAKNTSGKDLIGSRTNRTSGHWGHPSVPAAYAVFFVLDANHKVLVAYDNWNIYDGTEYGVYIQFGAKLAEDKYNTVAMGVEGWSAAKFDKYDEKIKASVAYTNHKDGWRSAYDSFVIPADGYVYGWGRATLEGQEVFKTAYSDVINSLLKHGNVEAVPTQVKTYNTKPSFNTIAAVVEKLSSFEYTKSMTNSAEYPIATAHDKGSSYSYTVENDPTTFKTTTYKAEEFKYYFKRPTDSAYTELVQNGAELNLKNDLMKILDIKIVLTPEADPTNTCSRSFKTTIISAKAPFANVDASKLQIEPYKAFNPKSFLEKGIVTVDDGYGNNVSLVSDITVMGMNLSYPTPGHYQAMVYYVNVYNLPVYKFFTIVVKDYNKPVIVTRDITINYGQDFHFEDGVINVKDESSYNLGLLSDSGFSSTKAGSYRILLEAVDEFGNVGNAYYNVTVLSKEASPATAGDLNVLTAKVNELMTTIGHLKGYIIEVLSLLDALFQ